MAWILRLVAVVTAGALLLTAVVIGVAPRLWLTANAHEELPVVLPGFEPLSQRTYVYDRGGAVLAVFERENSQPIALSQVPKPVIDAILAVEDNEFYVHKGVNVRGLMRATLSNFASDAPRQGASTITQQVVKNEFLAGLERDGRYKLLQVHYALMLEKVQTKDQILERYLNTIFFGNNAYGLQAASEIYFGKSVEQLDQVEGAFLAGLIRSPSGYDPFRRPDRARARFLQVTERLTNVGILTPEQATDLGANWPIPEVPKVIPQFATKPTYYTEALRDYLVNRSNILGATKQERENKLYRGGLKIYTTLDAGMQLTAEEARKQLPDNKAGIDAAIVTLDSRTGAIRAMVGGRGYVPRQRELNMALAPRQTGSSIKMFVLAAAVQAGAQPNDLINGTLPCVMPNVGDPNEPLFPIKSGATRGVLRLDQATWLSLNCAYGRLAQSVGLNRVVDTVYRTAQSPYFYRGQPKADHLPFDPIASIITGGNEMSPLDMASGAQTLANNGVHLEPYYVDYVERADGARIYTHESVGTQVFDEAVALQTTDILKGVLREGTARRALADFPFPAAGKTGTQADNTNSWFVGYTPQLTTAVWVGDPDGYTEMTTKNVPEFNDLGSAEGVQGGTYPARIWRALMEPTVANLPVEDFAPPPPLTRKPVRIYLPGEECAYRVVSGVLPDPNAPSTTRPVPPPTVPVVDPADPAAGEVPATVPPVVVQLVPGATTIPPDVLDPRAPLASIDTKTSVLSCLTLPPTVTVKGAQP
ncbi:MAG: transglycosylase domain-containing protein [Ilumatobacteraceae bacterium]